MCSLLRCFALFMFWLLEQGTNAHAILGQDQGKALAATPTVSRTTLWQRRRLWYAPPTHVLLQRGSCKAGVAHMSALITRAHMACMWDHRVTFFPEKFH